MEKLSWLSEHGYQILLDRLQDGIFAIEEGKVIYVNQRMADMLGYQVNELIGRPFVEIIAAEDRPLAFERHHARLAGKKVPENYDLRFLTARGETVFCSINVGLGETKIGGAVTVGSVRDVTQQRAALAALEESKADLKAIVDNLPDIFYRTDMQGIITTISPACFDLVGYLPEEMIDLPLADYYYDPEEKQSVVQAVIDGGGKPTQVEARMKHKNGTVVWISANLSVRYGLDGKPSHIEGLSRDISKRKQMEEQLIILSRIDGLTGAVNRRYFMDKSEEVIGVMKRYQRPASLMIMDLDHFKNINDNYGHQAGDLALKAFADVCGEEIRESDIFGRLGGEEFGLMLPETTIQHAKILAERIRNAAAALEIKLNNKVIRFTVSIGLVELGTDDASIDAAMHRADLAMYQAKVKGRNQVVVPIESR